MQMFRHARRGSLATALVLSAMMLALGLTVASATMFNLTSTTRGSNSQLARDLADSALQQALARLMQDPTYGEGSTPPVVVEDAALPEGAQGELRFGNSGSQPYSTNNRDGTRSTGWNSTAVPERKAHLVATGRCGGVERRVEMMVHIPNFPLVMGSEGGVRAATSLIGAIKNPATVTWDASGRLIYSKADLEKGDLVSNGRVTLVDDTTVTGSVQAVQGLTLQNSKVSGEILSPYERADIPMVDVAKYDPALDRDTFYEAFPATSVSDPSPMSGVRKYNGSLTVSGPLTLHHGVVFVTGNLRVTQGVVGQGAVFVMGNARLGGGSRLGGTDNVSLLVRGETEIEGNSGSDSVFQGTVFSGGPMRASRMNLIGTFLSASAASEAVRFVDCTVLYSTQLAAPAMVRSIDLVLPRFGGNAYSVAGYEMTETGHIKGLVQPGLTATNVQDCLGLSPDAWERREALSSRWEVSDPCVLHLEYDDDIGWKGWIQHWGRGGGGPVPLPLSVPATVPIEQLIVQMQGTVANSRNFMGDAAPSEDVIRQRLTAIKDQLDLFRVDPKYVFRIGPNEFLGDDSERFRVLYRRELP